MPTTTNNSAGRVSIINYSGNSKSLIRSLNSLTGFCNTSLEEGALNVELADVSKPTIDYALETYTDGFTLYVVVSGEDLVFTVGTEYSLIFTFADDTSYNYGSVVIPQSSFSMCDSVTFGRGDVLILHEASAGEYTVVNSKASRPVLSSASHSSGNAYTVKGSGYSGSGAGTKFLREDGTWQSISGGGGSSDAVLYTPQSLSAGQQQQARTNIGAVGSEYSETTPDLSYFNYAVLYTPQSLSTGQQAQARTNIGAQDALVSGQNIATINGNSLLEGVDIQIQTGGTSDYTQLSNKPSINGQTLEGNITISGDTVIDNTHLNDAGSNAVTLATDSMNLRARLLGVNATEEKATFTPVVGSYYNYRTDSFTESANNNYAVFNVQGKSFVRFMGLFPNIINYSSGYCFKDSDDNTLFKSGWDIDTSMSASTTKEYIARVPEGAVTFITHVKSSGVASLESNFYCYIGTGNTVYDNLNDKLISENEVRHGFNLISRDTVQPGRLGTKGEVVSTSDYYVTPFVPLNGTTVYFRGATSYGSTTNGAAIYDKNFNCVKVFRPAGTTSYTPENDYAAYIRLTLTKGSVDNSGSIAGVFYALPDGTSPNLQGMYNTITLPDNEQKYETKYTTDITVHKENVPELLPIYSSVAGSKGYSVFKEVFPSNNVLLVSSSIYPSYIKDVHTIAAKAYFEGDFPSDAWVRVGTNRNSSAGKTVQINATTIAIRSYNNQSSAYVTNISFTHGLTLKDFIMLEVNFTWDGGYIRLISGGGAYIKEWKVSDYTLAGGAEYLNYGRAYIEQNNVTLSNVTLRQNSEAFKKPIWILGDSYTSMYSQRWTYQLVLNYKVDNFLLSGFAGATSAQMFAELQKLLNYGTPKYLVWCLGMNDGNYDATWLVTAKQIEGICAQKGIELVYQTIPQPTSGNRQLINNYIKSSGYRYVDAFSAVCKPDGTWYDGMNDDGTHPTMLGGKAIAGQFLIDLPELTHGGSLIIQTGSGGGGTTDYTDLTSKPKINNVELSGDLTSSGLGLQDTLVSGTNIATINNQSLLNGGNIVIPTGGGGGTFDGLVTINTYGSTSLRENYYWQSAVAVGGTMPKNPKYNTGFRCMSIDVEPGDICEIRTKGGSSGRAYCLTDMYRVVKEVAAASANYLSTPATVTVTEKGHLFVSMDTSTSSNIPLFSVIVKANLATKIELLRQKTTEALTPPPFKNGTLRLTTSPKILWLGNSYSENTLQYISSMTGSLSSAPTYSIYLCKVSSTGLSYWADKCTNSETVTPALNAGQDLGLTTMTLPALFAAQPWDVVMLQQVSTSAGNYSTYEPYLSTVIQTLRENCHNPNVAVGWNLIWSNKYTTTGAGLDGAEYYNLIADATKTMMTRNGLDIIVPAGTAIQNCRNDSDIVDTDEFVQDTSGHLNSLGQLIAGYTWFECILGKLLGISILDINYNISGGSAETLQKIKKHVMNSISNMWSVTA